MASTAPVSGRVSGCGPPRSGKAAAVRMPFRARPLRASAPTAIGGTERDIEALSPAASSTRLPNRNPNVRRALEGAVPRAMTAGVVFMREAMRSPRGGDETSLSNPGSGLRVQRRARAFPSNDCPTGARQRVRERCTVRWFVPSAAPTPNWTTLDRPSSLRGTAESRRRPVRALTAITSANRRQARTVRRRGLPRRCTARSSFRSRWTRWARPVTKYPPGLPFVALRDESARRAALHEGPGVAVRGRRHGVGDANGTGPSSIRTIHRHGHRRRCTARFAASQIPPGRGATHWMRTAGARMPTAVNDGLAGAKPESRHPTSSPQAQPVRGHKPSDTRKLRT